jgi:hypothetical protein
MFKPIYSEEEHIQVLFELGLLDDMEDWELFKEQEKRFDIDDEAWIKYCSRTSGTKR